MMTSSPLELFEKTCWGKDWWGQPTLIAWWRCLPLGALDGDVLSVWVSGDDWEVCCWPGDTASGVRSRTDTESVLSPGVLHPASAHAPDNVTCSGDSGEGRPLCGKEESGWAFDAKWSFYSTPIILIFGSILSRIVSNKSICCLTVRVFIEIHNRRCALSHHQ